MEYDREQQGSDAASASGGASVGAAGKRTRSEHLPGQRRGQGGGHEAGAGSAEHAPGGADHGAAEDPFFFAEGAPAAEAGAGNMDPGAMQSLYYGVNPPRHAEKAYQAGDSAPPLHPRPTTVGRSGTIVALATSIYNRPPFGKVARFSICDRGGRVLHAGAVTTPGQVSFGGMAPGTECLIRPETMGTMVKLLTPEQIAGATEPESEHEGHGAEGASGADAAAAGDGNLSPGAMQSLYYGINPPRHAEKAYQAGDSAPPLHPRPTTVGRSGTIVALATSIYNRPPFGKLARFSICDRGGRVLHAGAVTTPGQVSFGGMAPGTEVLIRPETMGTMVKLLTPEQIAGATEPESEHEGRGAEGASGADAAEGGEGNMAPAAMQSLYYGVNPPRHAEKAYQASDPAPPLHPRPTTVGRSGTIVALATSIHNRPPFGKVARFSICDRGGGVLHTGSVKTPGQISFGGMAPGTEVLIRPETVGTMVKLLTPEQIAGATGGDDEHQRAPGRDR